MTYQDALERALELKEEDIPQQHPLVLAIAESPVQFEFKQRVRQLRADYLLTGLPHLVILLNGKIADERDIVQMCKAAEVPVAFCDYYHAVLAGFIDPKNHITTEEDVNLQHTPPKRDTRTNKVYFMEASDKIKIGISLDPARRLEGIRSHVPGLKLIGFIEGNQSVERSLHEKFKHLRLHGEWFAKTKELMEYISTLTRNFKTA